MKSKAEQKKFRNKINNIEAIKKCEGFINSIDKTKLKSDLKYLIYDNQLYNSIFDSSDQSYIKKRDLLKKQLRNNFPVDGYLKNHANSQRVKSMIHDMEMNNRKKSERNIGYDLKIPAKETVSNNESVNSSNFKLAKSESKDTIDESSVFSRKSNHSVFSNYNIIHWRSKMIRGHNAYDFPLD